MATVTVKFIPLQLMINMYSKTSTAWVRQAIADKLYTNSDPFTVTGLGLAAAEEVFDITNNPSRQDEREQVYGKGRSVSVGDIVVVGDEMYLCKSIGWEVLEPVL